MALLTVLHLCDNWVGVEGFTNSKLVHSRDSELVLVALDKVGGIVRTSFTFRCDHSPSDSRCFPLLHHIVDDGSTAVILWWVPPYCALLSCDAGEADGTLNRSRGICWEME